MLLTRHQAEGESRWALGGKLLPARIDLAALLGIHALSLHKLLPELATHVQAQSRRLAPVQSQEVWAAASTYPQAHAARMRTASMSEAHEQAYGAERPELIFQGSGFRMRGDGDRVRIRRDALWSTPEPQLALVINAHEEVVGYAAANTVCARDIEASNPLYVPQARNYEGSCALGPGILLATPEQITSLRVRASVRRDGRLVYEDGYHTAAMKRSVRELSACLHKELSFPEGVFLLSGCGMVPPDALTLKLGDCIEVQVGELRLANIVG